MIKIVVAGRKKRTDWYGKLHYRDAWRVNKEKSNREKEKGG